jgi:hypothetical protein
MPNPKQCDVRHLAWVTVSCLCLMLTSFAATKDIPRTAPVSLLDQGFSGLYNLDFTGAQKDFTRWQRLADLQTTADHGHYLAPFARILLAIAYVREEDKSRALATLTALRAEFPANPLFAREISRLQGVQ